MKGLNVQFAEGLKHLGVHRTLLDSKQSVLIADAEQRIVEIGNSLFARDQFVDGVEHFVAAYSVRSHTTATKQTRSVRVDIDDSVASAAFHKDAVVGVLARVDSGSLISGAVQFDVIKPLVDLNGQLGVLLTSNSSGLSRKISCGIAHRFGLCLLIQALNLGLEFPDSILAAADVEV